MKRTRLGAQEHIIILIDGECLLCHRLARFVGRRDGAGRFRFAALRSAAGRRLLSEGRRRAGVEESAIKTGRAPNTAHWDISELEQSTADRKFTDTFVIIEDGRYYVKSTAALRVLRRLGGLWPLMYGAIVLPAFIRDGVYDLIARSRYRVFGRGQSFCELHAGDDLQGRLIGEGEADDE